jgi:hypothetical protein
MVSHSFHSAALPASSLGDDIRHYISAHRFFDQCIHGETDAFGSYAAFLAFLRRNQIQLVDAGLYLPRQGSAGSLVHVEIGTAIPKILREEQRQIARLSSGLEAPMGE